ncbi:uncharacterized protein [Nicotiana sylvestris]|uniref:uncharacterized protein n=1 Tax=Nicotiana sylvestris TaxID=4096 RepID=UPI00388CE625
MGRGRPRGGGQAGRGQPATTQLGGGQPAGALARFYALSAILDALSSDAIITSIIFVCGRDASVLFDPGSTYSYVSSLFSHFLVVPREPLDTPVHASIPVGNSVVVDRIYWSCVIAMPESPRLEWNGSLVDISSRVISFLKARYMVKKGCLAYLAYLRDTTVESPMIDSVLVVRLFADVFPYDLPSMPPDRDIYFCIDLVPGAQPISIPPYRMASKELKKLKEQF